MISTENQIVSILEKRKASNIQVKTLGSFQLSRASTPVSSKVWGRASSIQLFQFFVTNRHRHGIHKEQIIDRLWGDVDSKTGQQYFKIAHHGINKVLEPERESRKESKYIIRQGATYQLDFEDIWIDVESLDQLIALANKVLSTEPEIALKAYREAIELYQGTYLPDRLFEDWTSEERERVQLLVLGAYINLSELLVSQNPLECVRLTQEALQIDSTWEDAYRIQMEAYYNKGNRPMAIKTYKRCQKILREEFDIDPLPETQAVFKRIME